MTRPLVLVDLDDTLFQSRRKCPAVEVGHLALAAEASNGRHSYTTRAQGNLFAWLSQTAEVVPVTARGSEAYARVRLPFQHGAVLANGAVILLPDGREDAAWHTEVAGALAGVGGDLERLLDRGRRLAHDAGLRLRSWIVREGGLGAYAVFKDDADADGAGLAALAGALAAPPGWTLHRNGNNLAYIPGCISKRRACEHLLTGVRGSDPGRLVVGIGDSVSDLGFMSLCDLMATPSRGQLADLLAGVLAEGRVPAPGDVVPDLNSPVSGTVTR